MQIKDILNMTKEEMNNKIISLKKDLLDARFKLDLVKLKDTSCIRKIKKNIACIKTVLKEQEISKNNHFLVSSNNSITE